MRKFIIKGLAGLTVFGAIFASASTLGVLTNTGVGASSTAVTACDINGVQTAETSAWSETTNQYEVGKVTVSGIANACDGQTLSVTITGDDGKSMGAGDETVEIAEGPGDSSKLVTIAPGAKTEDIEMIHVNISPAA
jgi:hypothetical protein